MVQKVFPGRFESLAGISLFIQENIASIGFSEFELYAIETAVDEACSNIIEHAYKGKDKGDITCFVSPSTDRVEIVIKDSGRPFIPKKVQPPDLDSHLQARKNHGLGLYFIYQWMDEVDFRREGPLNVLRMVKIKKPVPK